MPEFIYQLDLTKIADSSCSISYVYQLYETLDQPQKYLNNLKQ